MQRITFHAMGCQMMAALDSSRPAPLQRLAETPAWFEAWEQRLSRFRPDSEVSRLNRHRGEPQAISALLAEVIHAALQAQRESNGLVDPLLLDALEHAGYDRSFEQLAENSPSSSPADRAHSPHRPLHLDVSRRRVTLPPEAGMDLGGIAKGWAADRAARRLGKLAPALVDAGGDIAASAPQVDGSPWPVGVADPSNPESSLGLLALRRGGVATSGRDYRRWRQGGIWQHHILDPRSGQAAQTDVLSATVVAPSARMAEAAAKAVLILGSQAGLRWLDDRAALAGLVVLEDGSAVPSQKWPGYLWR